MIARPPSGLQYDFWAGHLDRLDPAPSPLDDAWRESARALAAASPEEQREFTASLSADDGYTLFAFSERAAILGLRHRDPALVRDGLTIVTAINPDTMDYRDQGWTIEILLYSMTQLGMPVEEELESVIRRAVPRHADYLRIRMEQHAWYQAHLEIYRRSTVEVEVDTPNGPGFIHRGSRPYEPLTDLIKLALGLVPFVRSDRRYQLDRVECAVEPPWCWFGVPWIALRDEFEPRIKGSCSIWARLRPETTPSAALASPGYQGLLISATETDNAGMAQRLNRLANDAKDARSVMLGLPAGCLSVIVLGASIGYDGPPFETRPGLERFRDPISRCIESATPSAKGS